MVSKRGARLVVALLLAFPSLAHAEPTAAEKETARALMNEGRARRERGDEAGALSSFKAADALMHVPTTGLETAKSQAALGQLVEARDTLRPVLRTTLKPSDPRPFAEAQAHAQALDEELAARIPTLRLVLRNAPPDATPAVKVDGAEIPAEAVSVPLKVNPGHHVIDAAAGGATAHAELDVAERATAEAALTFDTPADGAGGGVAVASPGDERSPAGVRALTYGGFALAGVGVVAGAITGLVSLHATNDAKAVCDGNHCPASASADLDTAHATATVSTAAFIAAGVGAGVGLVGLWLDRHHEPKASETARVGSGMGGDGGVRVVPWLGPASAGVRGTF